MSDARGVWVAGPTRSGTNMTAGALAACGVFFGTCAPPAAHNAKGLLENVWLFKQLQSGAAHRDADWPASWFAQLQREGWDQQQPWGAKCSPSRWPIMRRTTPAIIVFCWRKAEDILASRRRAGFHDNADQAFIDQEWARMQHIRRESRCPVVDVRPDDLVAGDYARLTPALDVLGLPLDRDAVAAWVDPALWVGREVPV